MTEQKTSKVKYQAETDPYHYQYDEDEDQEANIVDFFNFFKRNYRTLILTLLSGALIGLVLTYVIPKQFQATALVKIGQLGNVGSAGTPIESSLQVVDRIKSRSFQDDVLEALKIETIDDDNSIVKRFRDTLNVKLEKSDLMTLTVKALSREEAKRQLSSVIIQLNIVHRKMSNPTINRLNLELESIKTELKFAESESKRLANLLEIQPDTVTDKKFSQIALLSNLHISREGEIRSFNDTKRLLEEKLSQERTFPTHVLGRVEVTKKVVFPKKSIFMLIGTFIGLILGLFWIVAQNAILRNSKDITLNNEV